MSKQTMSQIVAAYNELATAQGKELVSSFKNLSAARAALKSLESDTTMTNETVETVETVEAEEQVVAGLETPSNSGPKYNTAGKRGPAQGIGAFAKGMIADGKTNQEILDAIAAQFPTAKTTRNCIAYYRTQMAKAAKQDAEVVEVVEVVEVAEEAAE